jgi:uncharacterized protein YhbP (UPF0306 family)
MSESREEIMEAIGRLLGSQSTLVLSTCDAAGRTHATPLFYLAGADFELYWLSSKSSIHSRNAEIIPQVSAAIYAATERWQEIRGVQMHGTVSRITERKQRREISKQYRSRFQLNDAFRVVMARNSLYVFRPCWIRYLDNTRRFGFKFEVDLPIVQEEQ